MPQRILAAALLVAATLPTAVHSQTPVVYHVHLVGSVGLEATRIVERALAVAAEGVGSAVILQVESRGGRFDVAQLIAADIAATGVPVYVLVSGSAWGAAALVAVAGDSLFMVPGSSIGAGVESGRGEEELSEAARNAMYEAFRAQAVRRGLPPELLTAMVASREDPGARQSVTYDVDDAVDRGVAQGRVDDLSGLLGRVGLADLEIISVGSGWTGTTVEVENHNTRDVRVSVLRGGTRYTLGMVTSMRLVAFELPIDRLSDGARIRVLAEVVGSSEQLLTETIRVEPGLVVRWVLEDPLRYSSFSYFVRQY